LGHYGGQLDIGPKFNNIEGAVPFHQGQESSVEGVSHLDLVCILTQEEDTFVDQIADDETQDLP